MKKKRSQEHDVMLNILLWAMAIMGAVAFFALAYCLSSYSRGWTW